MQRSHPYGGQRAPRSANGRSIEPSRTLFVRGLPNDIPEDRLTEMFNDIGALRKIVSMAERRGMAFVSYYDIRHATHAVETLDQSKVGSQWITVQYSVPKPNSPHEKSDFNNGSLFVTFQGPDPKPDIDIDNECHEIFKVFGDIQVVRNVKGDYPLRRYVDFFDVRDAEAAKNTLHTSKTRDYTILVQFNNAHKRRYNDAGHQQRRQGYWDERDRGGDRASGDRGDRDRDRGGGRGRGDRDREYYDRDLRDRDFDRSYTRGGDYSRGESRDYGDYRGGHDRDFDDYDDRPGGGGPMRRSDYGNMRGDDIRRDTRFGGGGPDWRPGGPPPMQMGLPFQHGGAQAPRGRAPDATMLALLQGLRGGPGAFPPPPGFGAMSFGPPPTQQHTQAHTQHAQPHAQPQFSLPPPMGGPPRTMQQHVSAPSFPTGDVQNALSQVLSGGIPFETLAQALQQGGNRATRPPPQLQRSPPGGPLGHLGAPLGHHMPRQQHQQLPNLGPPPAPVQPAPRVQEAPPPVARPAAPTREVPAAQPDPNQQMAQQLAQVQQLATILRMVQEAQEAKEKKGG